MNGKIGLASDHAGFAMKEFMKVLLGTRNILFEDFGTYTPESCDYADYAHPLALAVEGGACKFGIAVCGSGTGINITMNKHQGIRSALCWSPEIASLARRHNDANVLALPGRFISNELAEEILDAFLSAEFEGGRHIARVKKIPITE